MSEKKKNKINSTTTTGRCFVFLLRLSGPQETDPFQSQTPNNNTTAILVKFRRNPSIQISWFEWINVNSLPPQKTIDSSMPGISNYSIVDPSIPRSRRAEHRLYSSAYTQYLCVCMSVYAAGRLNYDGDIFYISLSLARLFMFICSIIGEIAGLNLFIDCNYAWFLNYIFFLIL